MGLSLLAAAASVIFLAGNHVIAQECDVSQPCVSPDAIVRFASYQNNELFTPVVTACGNTTQDLYDAVFGACANETARAPGCSCESAACSKAMQGIDQECKDAVIQASCLSAPDVEGQTGLNIRGLFFHLLNDCGTGNEADCPAGTTPFNDTVCGAFVGDEVAGKPRCAEGPESAEGPSVDSTDVGTPTDITSRETPVTVENSWAAPVATGATAAALCAALMLL